MKGDSIIYVPLLGLLTQSQLEISPTQKELYLKAQSSGDAIYPHLLFLIPTLVTSLP